MNPRLVYARYVGAPVQLLEYNDLEFPTIPTLQYDNLISIRLNGMTPLNIKTSQICLFQTRLGIPQKLVCVYDICDYEILNILWHVYLVAPLEHCVCHNSYKVWEAYRFIFLSFGRIFRGIGSAFPPFFAMFLRWFTKNLISICFKISFLF